MRLYIAPILCFLVISSPTPLFSQMRPATADEQKELLFMGITGEAAKQTSDATIATLRGGCDILPYPYLEERHKPGTPSNSFVTPRNGQNGIDSALACRLKKLFEFAEQNGCKLTIGSAMRPEQRCNPNGGACAPQGGSCHQYGLAVDINGTPRCLAWVTDLIGRQNPNSPYGLHVAYKENANYRHIQCAEHLSAGRNSCTGPCKGGMRINYDGAPPPRPSPTTAFSNAIRQWLSPQQQPQPQQVVAATPSQPASASQNPLAAFQESQTIGGVSGQLTMTPTASTTNTIADRLESLAFPTTTQAGGTATTVPLVVSGAQAAQLTAGQQPTTTVSYTGSGSVSPSQNTFISGDLSWQGAPQLPQTQTGFQATLANVRSILERILAFLTPFNARHVIGIEENHEHLE